jgi:hypothetical protein
MSDVDSGRCYRVDAPGVVGSSVRRENCSGGPEQNVEAVGSGGIVALRFTEPVNAGLCAMIDPNDDSWVVMAPCDGSARQQFTLVDNGGSHTLVSQENGSCLDSSGYVRARNCDGDPDQRFTFS